MSGAIKINGTSSGSTTITAPASGADETIELSTVLAGKANLAGSVVQVVQGVSTTPSTIASTTYSDTGLSATITPTASTSKILVIVNQAITGYRESLEATAAVQLVRDSTVILTPDGTSQRGSLSIAIQSPGTYVEMALRTSITYLDSPASTSALTYKTQGRVQSTASNGQMFVQRQGAASFLTLIEVAQ